MAAKANIIVDQGTDFSTTITVRVHRRCLV